MLIISVLVHSEVNMMHSQHSNHTAMCFVENSNSQCCSCAEKMAGILSVLSLIYVQISREILLHKGKYTG